ncbi:MAG: hypothetical protein SWO11_21875 [Thermodesulfobacteriota bacterium]|nr:hypothetical protein [Thermodesulfobacteriota bacterium]
MKDRLREAGVESYEPIKKYYLPVTFILLSLSPWRWFLMNLCRSYARHITCKEHG